MTNNLEHSSMVLTAITSDELITTIDYTAPNVGSLTSKDLHRNPINRRSGKIASKCAIFSIISLAIAGATIALTLN